VFFSCTIDIALIEKHSMVTALVLTLHLQMIIIAFGIYIFLLTGKKGDHSFNYVSIERSQTQTKLPLYIKSLITILFEPSRSSVYNKAGCRDCPIL